MEDFRSNCIGKSWFFGKMRIGTRRRQTPRSFVSGGARYLCYAAIWVVKEGDVSQLDAFRSSGVQNHFSQQGRQLPIPNNLAQPHTMPVVRMCLPTWRTATSTVQPADVPILLNRVPAASPCGLGHGAASGRVCCAVRNGWPRQCTLISSANPWLKP